MQEKPLPITINFIEHFFTDEYYAAAIYDTHTMTLVKANRHYLSYLGADGPIDRHLNKRLEEIVPVVDEDRLSKFYNILQDNKTIHNYSIRTADRLWDSTITPVFENGKLRYIFVMAKDVTEKTKLAEETERQAALLNMASEAIFTWSLDRTILYWNKGAERMYGFSSAEAIGANIDDLLRTEFRITPQELTDILSSNGVWAGTLRQYNKAGKKLIIEISMRAIDDKGRIIVMEVNRDATSKTLILNSLKEREMHLRLAAEGADIGTYTYDFKNKKAYFSHRLKAILSSVSLHPENLQNVYSYLEQIDSGQRFQKAMETSIDPKGSGEISFDYQLTLPDGTYRWYHIKGLTYFKGEHEDKRPVFASGVVIDITRRVATEISLMEKSVELMNIIESSDDFIFSVSPDMKILLCNSAITRFMAAQYGILFEKDLYIQDVFTPDSTSIFREFISKTVSEGKINVDISLTHTGRTMSVSFNPVYVNSEIVEITVFSKDITERINTEKSILKQNELLENMAEARTLQLQQSVQDLKSFILTISHDLKNPIMQIQQLADRLKAEFPSNKNLDRIISVSSTAAEMLQDLLEYQAFSMKDLSKTRLKLKRLIIKIFDDLKPGYNNNALLDFETGLPSITADKTLIVHALTNIMTNALKFSCHKEQPMLVVGCFEENGAYVFYFKDNGIGFDAGSAGRLFGIFERLHQTDYKGNGIGLATVKNIIERHGGRTWIEGVPQKGCTFYFSLSAEEVAYV